MRRTFTLIVLVASLAACTDGAERASTPTPSPTSSTAPPPSTTPTTTPPPPSTFAVRDSTWVSDSVGWVLGGADCGERSCLSMTSTIDAGRTWRKTATPGGARIVGDPSYDCTASPECISHLRFADRSTGYAFGPGFYVTRDGARTWHRESAPMVLNLEISRGRAFRVVAMSTGCPGPCDVRVETSDVGSRTWRRLPTPRQDAVGTSLVVDGNRLYLGAFANTAGGAGDAHTRFTRSLDGGRTWGSFPDPCGYSGEDENDATSFAAAPGGFLAVLCTSRLHPEARSFVVTSSDSGRSFGPRRALPNAAAMDISVGSAGNFAVTAIRAARCAVLVSHVGGRTWRLTLEGPGAEGLGGRFFLGFQDERTARVAFAGSSIWTTRDAGRTWRAAQPFRN